MQIRAYCDSDFSCVDALWQEAFPDDPPHNQAELAIPAKLAIQPELFLVACNDGGIAGTIMAGYDGHRGWLYAVAVSHKARRQGIGTALVRAAEQALRGLGCSKVNLQIRSDNSRVAKFYQSLGYGVEERISMGRRL